MDLSIIIALYNTEKYIKKCVESIYENNNLERATFEVIVINDGSTDNSPKIVKELQNKYANLILLNKENGGQSSARNQGFKIAKGEYIFCLDSDDFINSYELGRALVFCKEKDLDLLPINLTKYNEDIVPLNLIKDNYVELMNQIIDGGEFLNCYVIYGSMCRYIYKKSIMANNNLYLTEGIYHEDEEFVIKFISYCNVVSYKNHLVYHQIVRNNSTTQNADKTHRLKLVKDLAVVILRLDEFSREFDKKSKIYKGVLIKKEQLLVTLFLRLEKKEIAKEEKVKIIKLLKTNDLFPLKLKDSRLKFKIFAFFMNLKWKSKLQ